jgi:hypothetical protein
MASIGQGNGVHRKPAIAMMSTLQCMHVGKIHTVAHVFEICIFFYKHSTVIRIRIAFARMAVNCSLKRSYPDRILVDFTQQCCKEL